jgi:hypothetical protein
MVLGPPAPPTVGRNYYQVRLRRADGGQFWILLNAAAPVVAATAASDDGGVRLLAVPFVDVPRPDLFSLAALPVATPKELEQPLTDGAITGLLPSERRDIAYHAPARVGDVIFNWFD